MKVLLAILALLAVVTFIQLSPAAVSTQKPQLRAHQILDTLVLYKHWRAEHRAQALHEDIDYLRYYIWVENFNFINAHNQEGHTYFVGMNHFGDLSHEEFKAMYLEPIRKHKVAEEAVEVPISAPNAANIDIDWSKKGVVGQVLNQGACGGCWAFATVENLQSVTALNTGSLPAYSMQQLIDCSSSFGNLGCNGGVVQWAFDYVIQNGIELYATYPFTGKQGTCKYNASKIVSPTPLKSYVDIVSGNCDQVATGIQQEPVAIAFDASGVAFQFYKGGVYSNCGTALSHAVLLTGYKNNNNQGYWIAENSWGTGWGEKGFFQLALGNTCGLCNQATYANLNYK
jgi:hypothetical protein